MLNAAVQNVQRHLNENRSIYFFMTGLFVMGLLFGAIIVNALPSGIKSDLGTYLTHFFKDISNGQDLSPKVIFTERTAYYIKYTIFLWILGFTIIGLPILFILIFLKGFVMGFSIGFLVGELKLKGFGLALGALFPQNLVIVPLFIVVAAFATGFSLRLFKQLNAPVKTKLFPYFRKYLYTLCIALIICTIVAFFEAHVTPVIIGYFGEHL